jgi:hypothetical protein
VTPFSQPFTFERKTMHTVARWASAVASVATLAATVIEASVHAVGAAIASRMSSTTSIYFYRHTDSAARKDIDGGTWFVEVYCFYVNNDND